MIKKIHRGEISFGATITFFIASRHDARKSCSCSKINTSSMTLPSYVSIVSVLPIVVRSAIDATYDQIGINVDLTLHPDDASGTPPFTDACLRCCLYRSTGSSASANLQVEVDHLTYLARVTNDDIIRIAHFNNGFSDQDGRVDGLLATKLQVPKWIKKLQM
jgi:hypothetical protein